MCAQFAALGLSFSFLDAVDGRKGLPEEFASDVDRAGTIARLGYPMSDSEYACALSHQLAYKKILDSKLSGAIILEDDVVLTENFRAFYETRSYRAAPLIQFFYLEAVVWAVLQRSTPAARLERLVHSAWVTVGYSISADAAARIRANSLPLRSHADWPCDTSRLVGHYITNPRIVLHPDPGDSQSTIVERNGLIPDDFDFSANYPKGWRRLLNHASWKRLLTRPMTRLRQPGFAPTAQENASIVMQSMQ